MARIHPNVVTPPAPSSNPPNPKSSSDSVVLTVWKKSLLFNCKGFTVFDGNGKLVFRVDNYMAASSEIVLMDASGRPLLTIRRKRLGLSESWLIYEGESIDNPTYCARKRGNILKPKSLANVSAVESSGNNSIKSNKLNDNINNNKLIYEIEGSYAQRCCVIYDNDGQRRRVVAEIKQKEAAVGGVAFGIDVFRLIVLPVGDFNVSIAMAMVILLDQMFGSSRR
ncbi:hypothetical protein K2173_000045 [Erythroxylum novogranatense]|uniref:Protein LURP-one-related 8 n=1 Tax=Erythroxylum novogranatense TaxID=1862640 RepID=A0AAV8SND9_9ROSI|nr:hypothetical protein K2173_000045 [Erythroxylum novogranatense]